MIDRDEVLALAREAGFTEKQMKAMFCDIGPYDITEPRFELELFAALIAAAQKERDAQICDGESESHGGIAEGPLATERGKLVFESMAAGAANCSAAIRAQGKEVL